MYATGLAVGGGADEGVTASAEELTEERIRAHILVERAGEEEKARRQQLLREGGDGLRADDTAARCDNTAQGPLVVTDANGAPPYRGDFQLAAAHETAGYVCTRRQLDSARPGCCNETDASLPRVSRFTCDACDTEPPHCCDVFEHCVSCCMHPLNVRRPAPAWKLGANKPGVYGCICYAPDQINTRREFLSHADPAHPVYGDPAALTVFGYCQFRCRSSSASVQHQNSYRRYVCLCLRFRLRWAWRLAAAGSVHYHSGRPFFAVMPPDIATLAMRLTV